jgi:hypothetical protein
MKKLVALSILGLLAVYGIGRFNLGEAGAMRFLTKMESLMNEGKGDEVCAMYHEDLTVQIADHSGQPTKNVNSGKDGFCALTRTTIAGLQLIPHSMSVEFTGVTAKHELTKPWTGDLSYSEHRTFSIPGASASLHTVSEDQITLVQTFSGVKILKIKSEIFAAETT